MQLFLIIFFFFNDTATTEIYTLSLHDALPSSVVMVAASQGQAAGSLTHRPTFALPPLSPERACTSRPSGPSTVGPKSARRPAGAGAGVAGPPGARVGPPVPAGAGAVADQAFEAGG